MLLAQLGFPLSVRELLQPALQDSWRPPMSWLGGACCLHSVGQQGPGSGCRGMELRLVGLCLAPPLGGWDLAEPEL